MSTPDLTQVLTKIATLEAELAGYRSQKTAAPVFDETAFRRSMTNDPHGTMAKMGINTDHVTRVMVAKTMAAMGQDVPPQLGVLAEMGPQINAVSALQTQLEQLSRQVSEMAAGGQKASTTTSFKALAVDKAKYPHLSKAYAADPSLFDDDLDGHKGSAEELATKLETKQAKAFKAMGIKVETAQPASENKAGDSVVQSQQDVPAATAASLSNEVPPLPQGKAGLWTDADHAKLRDEIVRKHDSAQ